MASLRLNPVHVHPALLITIILFLAVFMTSCKKETIEIKDLKFPLSTYYVSEGGEISLYINSGNLNYSLAIADNELIQAKSTPTDWPAGTIQVKGLKKGSTTLTVKDKLTAQEATLQIHVVDPYLVIRAAHFTPQIEGGDSKTKQAIRDEIINKQALFATFEEGNILVLQRNADQQFYIFKNEDDVAKGKIHQQGTYTLDFYYGAAQRLTLNYIDSEETDEFTVQANGEENFTKLFDFAMGQAFANKAGKNFTASEKQVNKDLKTGNIQGTSPAIHYSFYLTNDFTPYFHANYAEVKRVEIHHAMQFPHPGQHLSFDENILK